FENPAQLTFGFAWKTGADLTILGDYQYTWWDSFSSVNLDFTQDASGMLSRTLYENFNNTSAYRIGIEWQENEDWTFRAGFARLDAAAPDQSITPMLPEASGNNYDVGASVRISSTLRTDFSYQYHRQDDRRGRTRDPLGNALPTTGLNNGIYTLDANIVAVALGYSF
ncbi:MAG TPA: outer membrane protein transport protein, partial [Bacteroidota bacterium]|nr:outer membrane protein transport protein [Bacteroidota bacterium]